MLLLGKDTFLYSSWSFLKLFIPKSNGSNLAVKRQMLVNLYPLLSMYLCSSSSLYPALLAPSTSGQIRATNRGVAFNKQRLIYERKVVQIFILNLLGVDILPRRSKNHILTSPFYVNKSLLINNGKVSGMQPSIWKTASVASSFLQYPSITFSPLQLKSHQEYCTDRQN